MNMKWTSGDGVGLMRVFRNQSGLTLVEILVGVGLASIVSLAIYTTFNAQNRLFAGEKKVTQMISQARITLDQLAKQVRLAGLNPEEKTTGTFGIKDGGTTFTQNAMTSNSQIMFTSDYSEDGTVANTAYERVGYKWSSTSNAIQRASISSTDGSVSSWSDRYENITSFGVVYTYKNGTSSGSATLNAGSKTWTVTAAALPSDSVSNNNYDDIAAVTLFLSVRTETLHDMTRQYMSDAVCSTVMLRNATLSNMNYGTVTSSPCMMVW